MCIWHGKPNGNRYKALLFKIKAKAKEENQYDVNNIKIFIMDFIFLVMDQGLEMVMLYILIYHQGPVLIQILVTIMFIVFHLLIMVKIKHFLNPLLILAFVQEILILLDLLSIIRY